MEDARSTLKAYEMYIPTGTPGVERLFRFFLVASILGFVGLGLFFKTVKPAPRIISDRIERMRASFVIREKKAPPPKPKPTKDMKSKPIDLSEKPKLKAQEDDIQKDTQKKKVRRVYGLRKVYSKGLGAGGTLSDAVVGKLGNTLNKDVDDLKATELELKGEVVSVTTVDANPKYKRKPKPEYTGEMKENGVEGVIRVKVLIDADGKVKKAIVLNDLGFGSAELARKACFQALFEPAIRDGVPVAVWITIPIRFQLLGT